MYLFLVNIEKKVKISYRTLGDLVDELLLYYGADRIIDILDNEDHEFKVVFEYELILK